MTDKEAINYLKGQIKCLKCEKGIDCEKCRPNWSIENDIEALNRGIEAIKNQKTGHWIETDMDIYECSECHKGLALLEKENYCPHCGANMKGENK